MRAFAVVAAAAATVLVLLALAPAAAGDGGPAPGAVVGWDGVVDPLGSVRYVALTGRGTTVATITVEGGRVLDFRTLPGGYGIPSVAFDGTTAGVSADGSTLVLASFMGPVYPGQVSRFALLRPDNHLRTRRLVVLKGAFSFDAISPDGNTLYLIEYHGN